MNQPRVLLWVGLALLVWLNVNAWMKDYVPVENRRHTAAESLQRRKPPASRPTDWRMKCLRSRRGNARARHADARTGARGVRGERGPARSASSPTCSTST